MNRTKILSSLLTIGAAGSLLAGATFAFFNDQAQSTANTFTAGTLNLQLDDVNEVTPAESVTASLGGTMSPGTSTSGFISLHNGGGTLPIAEVEFGVDSNQTIDGGNQSVLKNVLNLTVVRDDATPDNNCVGGTDITSQIDLQVGNNTAPLTLAEFDDGGTDTYDALPGLTVGSTYNVCFTVTMDSSATNDYQGDAIDATFTFTGNQDASQ